MDTDVDPSNGIQDGIEEAQELGHIFSDVESTGRYSEPASPDQDSDKGPSNPETKEMSYPASPDPQEMMGPASPESSNDEGKHSVQLSPESPVEGPRSPDRRKTDGPKSPDSVQRSSSSGSDSDSDSESSSSSSSSSDDCVSDSEDEGTKQKSGSESGKEETGHEAETMMRQRNGDAGVKLKTREKHGSVERMNEIHDTAERGVKGKFCEDDDVEGSDNEKGVMHRKSRHSEWIKSKLNKEFSPKTSQGQDKVSKLHSSKQLDSSHLRQESPIRSESRESISSEESTGGGGNVDSETREGKKERRSYGDLSEISDVDSKGNGSLEAVSEDDMDTDSHQNFDAVVEQQRKALSEAQLESKRSHASQPDTLELDFEAEDQPRDSLKEEKPEEEEEEGEAEDGECENDDDDDSDDRSDGEVKDGDDLEEGEVSDEDGDGRSAKQEPRPICRFYNKGQCTWGSSCRFLHPGVTDKGNYSMFGPPRPLLPMNGPPGFPVGDPVFRQSYDRFETPAVGDTATTREVEPVFESAWERGLRHAKEMLKKSMKRKETDVDFEDKKMNLSLAQDELDKENDYYTRPASPIYREEPVRYDDPYFEPYDQIPRVDLHYENFQVRNVRAEVNEVYRKERVQHPKVQREVYERKAREKELPRIPDRTWREGSSIKSHVSVPRYAGSKPSRGRGDEWADPWMRSKSPSRGGRGGAAGSNRKRRSSKNRRRSYSSGSSYSSSRSSRSSSYSSSSRSSSHSSYSSYSSKSRSRSRSKSHSKSPASAKKKPAVPPRPGAGYVSHHMVMEGTEKDTGPRPVEKKPAVVVPPPRPQPPVGDGRGRGRQPPPPPPIRKPPEPPPASPKKKVGVAEKKKTPKARTKSYSDSEHSESQSHSHSSKSRSRSRSYSHSKSHSRSRSRSSSASSRSSYSSSSGSSRAPSPVARGKKPEEKKKPAAITTTAPKPMDALKLSGQKQQIKLTLKAPGAPHPVNKKVLEKLADVDEDQEVEQYIAVEKEKVVPTPVPPPKKRVAESPPETQPQTKIMNLTNAATAMRLLAKKTTSSRREELLKQLKAVEDAIARKRSKLT